MTRSSGAMLPGPPDPWAASEMPAFRGRPPYLMTEMIAAEPALADRLIHRLLADPVSDALTTAIRAARTAGAPIITTGLGTSEHAAMGVAGLLNEALDAPAGGGVQSLPALEVVRRPPTGGVLIAISHEGGTKVTLEALRASRAAGAKTALVTVGGGSPGAEIAEIVVRTEEMDQSWCHTVGYLSPLVAGVVLAARLRDTRPDTAAIRALLDVSDDARPAADVAAALGGVDRVLVAGSGTDLVTARELALKIAEGARLPTAAHELETLLHGHLAAATRWTGLVVVLTDSSPARLVHERAARLLGAAKALGMTAAAILADTIADEVTPDLTPAGRIVLPHTGRVPGVAGALLSSAMALQLLTERLARARQVNPDTIGREETAQAAAHA